MGKVVTSAGIQEFVQTGKFDTVPDHKPEKPNEAPPLEVKQEQAPVDIKPEVKEPVKPEEDGLEADDIDLTEHVRKKIGKKHRAMKEAQEKAEEAERFAENQYNERRLVEQRAAELEARLKELEAAKPQPKSNELKEPDEGDPQFMENGQFNWRKFTKAQADFAAQKAVAELTAKQEADRRAQEASEAEAQARKRITEAQKAHPDYDKVLRDADVKTHQAVLQYLTASEHIGEVSYYLAKNPEFVERINKLNPLKAIAEIGKLEASFDAPKAEPAASKAEPVASIPAPITPLPSQASVNTNTDPSKMSYKELRAYERSRRKRG